MVHTAATVDELGSVDVETLQRKYEEERTKRLNDSKGEQDVPYRPANFEDYLRDPYVPAGFHRDPVRAVYDITIVGGGYTGVQIAARLVQQGYQNICLIERGGDVGGTWYWNRYPGVQCDIDAYIYMPLLEETGNMPTKKYASGKELYEHAQKIAKKYDLYNHALLQTEMSKAIWDEATELWRICTNREDDILTKWLIPASGPFHTPKFPDIPGVALFKGKSFHSSRWDYAYTGGTVESPELTSLQDKRVGVIGTGATAVQIVPAISDWVKELYIFQRTPSAVSARNQKATDYDWVKKLSSGWQRERMLNFTTIISGGDVQEDLVNDGWTEAIRSTPGFFGTGGDGTDSEKLAQRQQLADFKKMESIRHRIDTIVKDKAIAEALKPYYQQFCKRPCFHDEYLEAFNQGNVHLVDTRGKGVERVSETGVYADGKEWPLDCIIYATGFEFGGDFTKCNAPIIGSKGLSLSEKWKDGPTTFHGWAVNGFPNLLLMGVPQSAPNPNWTHSMVEMGDHLIYIVNECEKRGLRRVEPSMEAERSWVVDALEKSKSRADFLKNCTPGYYNNDGEVNEKTLRAQPYSGGALMFKSITTRWREDGKLKGLTWKTMSDR